jgi:hypothetical protein
LSLIEKASMRQKSSFVSIRGTVPEKPRTPQEISARYQRAIRQYQSLMRSDNDNREQRVMLYAEIKTLGWCQGRDEQKIIQDINKPQR